MSSTDAPDFTVVMATWDRGRHILPSVRSALAQTGVSFEVLVVGDGCPADPGPDLAALGDARLRWVNLPERSGSQSGPNNAGIAMARGRHIAYLGHDDLWEPFHLADLARLFAADADLDFAVAGCIYHRPHGAPGSLVTGLFDDDAAKFRHFFPPSSLAHRRDVCDRIGPWLPPLEISAPVDADFALRAAKAGLRFASTGRVSAHKFAAGHRYLSYLRQESWEQSAMLPRLGTPRQADRVAALVADAHRLNRFMIATHRTYALLQPGELARQNYARKGLMQPAMQPLGQGLVLRQRDGFHALDWQDNPVQGVLWTKESPRPKILLPVTGPGPAALHLVLIHRDSAALGGLTVACDGQPLTVQRLADLPPGDRPPAALFRIAVTLDGHGPTILELILTPDQAPVIGTPGIGIGEMYLVPASPDGAATTGDAALRHARELARALPEDDRHSPAIP